MQRELGYNYPEPPRGYLGVSLNWMYLLRGPFDKDCSTVGSILGSPYFGKLPFRVHRA